ncbi:RHS repeat domain-containing protein [Proteus vulgaris]|uniref:RHS repeat domain-containing protein n=1 Tax=Proteus vulgaris TaxID=585 RepID=UPI0023619D93|nr:RHS repeat-associated core domain-containing protein [Proteus vulgaris]
MSNQQLYTRTPTVVVHDNRGSIIREINYCRHPNTINKTDERITRHHYHSRGYLEHSIDARLYEAQQSDPTIQPNIQQTISLGGALSLSQGIDNGIRFSLNDIEGTVSQQINAKGSVITYEYSKPEFVRNLEKVKEGSKVKQLLKWGNSDEISVNNNSVGKCITHYDTAGKKEFITFSLLGKNTYFIRLFHFGNDIHWEEGSYDMNQVEHAENYKTMFTYDATGAVLKETDAKGHQRRMLYDIAGFVKQSWVTLKGKSEQVILRSLTYSAAGQKLREEHGNGLVTIYEYEAETQRLLHVKTERPQGHALGAKIMQDLRYEYDPVGNIICLKNDAEATRYWRNQKVVPENRYVYDSLYQLASATGRESANQQTPASTQLQQITTLVKDAQSYTNYTRSYTYDNAGNLTQIRHNSPLAQQSFTQDIVVSNKTNRALLKSQCADPQQVDSYFDESGNLTKLLNGDALLWNKLNELEATNKKIESGLIYEGETYQYDSEGQRATKLRGRKQGSSDKLEKVFTHYLSNIDVWEFGEYPTREKYNIVHVQAGTSAKVRALCWEMGTPNGIENNSLRYSYDDGIGNSGLETDGKGQLVSYEEYYPYGGTAIWSSENAVEADYKMVRYSGQEKDSTGMYYYGYRYYQPWIGRWLSADPAGTIDGLNLYRMVRNNPVTLHDPDGRMPIPPAPPMVPPAPPMAPPAPPMMGGAPLPPPVPGGMQAISKPRKTWGDPLKNANSTALSDQQGGNYPYYTGFFRTLYVSKIKHYNDISNIKMFVDEWQGINEKSQRQLIKENINEQKVLYLQNKLNKMEEEWPKYVKTHEKTTYRGDGLSISETYPWFKDFVDEVKNKEKAVLKQVNIPVSAVSIMSTATTPKSGYVSNANVMWHFNLEPENLGVSMPVYKGEDEVTFPVYNKMKITSLQYLPEGSSYMNNPEKFGSSHRYIINANMLPRG